MYLLLECLCHFRYLTLILMNKMLMPKLSGFDKMRHANSKSLRLLEYKLRRQIKTTPRPITYWTSVDAKLAININVINLFNDTKIYNLI